MAKTRKVSGESSGLLGSKRKNYKRNVDLIKNGRVVVHSGSETEKAALEFVEDKLQCCINCKCKCGRLMKSEAIVESMRLDIDSKEEIIKMLLIDLQNIKEELDKSKQRDVSYAMKESDLNSFIEVKSKRNKNMTVKDDESDVITTLNHFEILGTLNKEHIKSNDNQENKDCQNNNLGKTINLPAKEAKKRVVVMGDSMLRNVSRNMDNAMVYCYPGIRAKHLINKIDEIREDPDVIFIHVGTNDLHTSQTPSQIMGDMKQLIMKAKDKFAGARIGISSVLYRRDMDYRYVGAVNSCLEWMCKDLNLLYLDGNAWIGDWDIGRDGLHLNRRGSTHFSRLLSRATGSLIPGN